MGTALVEDLASSNLHLEWWKCLDPQVCQAIKTFRQRQGCDFDNFTIILSHSWCLHHRLLKTAKNFKDGSAKPSSNLAANSCLPPASEKCNQMIAIFAILYLSYSYCEDQDIRPVDIAACLYKYHCVVQSYPCFSDLVPEVNRQILNAFETLEFCLRIKNSHFQECLAKVIPDDEAMTCPFDLTPTPSTSSFSFHSSQSLLHLTPPCDLHLLARHDFEQAEKDVEDAAVETGRMHKQFHKQYKQEQRTKERKMSFQPSASMPMSCDRSWLQKNGEEEETRPRRLASVCMLLGAEAEEDHQLDKQKRSADWEVETSTSGTTTSFGEMFSRAGDLSLLDGNTVLRSLLHEEFDESLADWL
eukprot:Platyproteum_vivax@DN5059_c0_g1_i1.p1